MGEIIRFKEHDDIVSSIEYVLEQAKRGEIINFVFAAQRSDGNIGTCWCKADLGTGMQLIGHLQADAMMTIVKVNS